MQDARCHKQKHYLNPYTPDQSLYINTVWGGHVRRKWEALHSSPHKALTPQECSSCLVHTRLLKRGPSNLQSQFFIIMLVNNCGLQVNNLPHFLTRGPLTPRKNYPSFDWVILIKLPHVITRLGKTTHISLLVNTLSLLNCNWNQLVFVRAFTHHFLKYDFISEGNISQENKKIVLVITS